MSEQYNTPMQNGFLRSMRAVYTDFWRNVMPMATETPAEVEPAQPKPAVKETEKPGTEIKNLWKTADESIDWTEALSHIPPADGLTNEKKWMFYHMYAERVLAGDLDAYTEVLKKNNPLGELTKHAENISIRTVSPSKLESTFICKAEYMEKNRKLYLSAMGLRIARDLLACLPVEEVTVKGEYAGETVFTATYPRLQLLHRNFMFVDPVELSGECGAVFTGI